MKSQLLNVLDFGATGSDFETKAHSIAGSNIVTVENVGDFKVGQQIIVKGTFISMPAETLFERRDNSPLNTRRWIHNQPLKERVELRGYDGTQGDWVVYAIDIAPEEPGVFRWTKNYGRDWTENVALTDGWIELSDGVEIKINDFPELEWGATAVIIYSNTAVTTIEAIDGCNLQLKDAPNKTGICTIMHSDSLALQNAIDSAIEKKAHSIFLTVNTVLPIHL